MIFNCDDSIPREPLTIKSCPPRELLLSENNFSRSRWLIHVQAALPKTAYINLHKFACGTLVTEGGGLLA